MKLHLLIELADGSFAFSVFFILGGAWAQGPQAAPPGIKKQKKQLSYQQVQLIGEVSIFQNLTYQLNIELLRTSINW